MRKFTFIGAGSLEFTNELVRDLMTFPAFDDCELMLMDINEKRLSYAKQGVEKIVAAGGHHATVKVTTDRREALEGADGVLITILQGGVEVWRHDIEIPKKYGVDICVGDTRGPSGIFRFLRTAPEMLAGWLNLTKEELDYTCAGINHQAFYLELTHDGQDMYPALREAIKRPEVANEEPVRIEMFKYDGQRDAPPHEGGRQRNRIGSADRRS